MKHFKIEPISRSLDGEPIYWGIFSRGFFKYYRYDFVPYHSAEEATNALDKSMMGTYYILHINELH